MNILFITHKVPYPPDKGEKIRAFHIIKHLSKKHKVILYSLCDNPADLKHADKLKEFCKTVHLYPINNILSHIRMFLYLFSGYPLTFARFFSYRMKKDIEAALGTGTVDMVFAYCSSSAQYALKPCKAKRVIDFVDIDSYKWKDYSRSAVFPFSLVYALEAQRLKKWEIAISQAFDYSIVTTDREKEILKTIDPGSKDKCQAVTNGIDLEFFTPRIKSSISKVLIFTGQMDYLPNVDAAKHFYADILPLVKKRVPGVKFYIVGRNPDRSISDLCKDAVITGFVEDIRDYLDMAAVYVAPLRLQFGIPNKILEAMAWGVPVVTAGRVLDGIKAAAGKDLLVADTPEEFARKVVELLDDEKKREFLSKNAREFVQKHHDWSKILMELDRIIGRMS